MFVGIIIISVNNNEVWSYYIMGALYVVIFAYIKRQKWGEFWHQLNKFLVFLTGLQERLISYHQRTLGSSFSIAREPWGEIRVILSGILILLVDSWIANWSSPWFSYFSATLMWLLLVGFPWKWLIGFHVTYIILKCLSLVFQFALGSVKNFTHVIFMLFWSQL